MTERLRLPVLPLTDDVVLTGEPAAIVRAIERVRIGTGVPGAAAAF